MIADETGEARRVVDPVHHMRRVSRWAAAADGGAGGSGGNATAMAGAGTRRQSGNATNQKRVKF